MLFLDYILTKEIFLFQYTDYDVVAKGYGGVGLKMDRSNDENIEEVLQKARKEHANGKSVLINALIGKTDFRDGSLSV